jgi:hypothetical protein
MISSAESSDMYKYPKGLFPILTTVNYAVWKGNMHHILRVILAWNIGDRIESIPPLAAPGATPVERSAVELWRMNYIQCYEDIAIVIYNIYSVSVCIYIDDINDTKNMWLTLSEYCIIASTAVGQQVLYQQFMSMRLVSAVPIGNYFSLLLEIRN